MIEPKKHRFGLFFFCFGAWLVFVSIDAILGRVAL